MARPVRRNIAHLTDPERKKYIDAVVNADKRFWSGGVVSYWDFQDLSHQTTHVHSGPKFLLWHRELCNRYERLLQEIDPDVALNYWDWTTDPRSSPNGATPPGTTDLSVNAFMGTMIGNVAGVLEPLHNKGVFAGSRDDTGKPQDPPQTLLRNLPLGAATAVTDATIIQTGQALPQAQQWKAFREKVEQVHGGVHVAFGAGNIGDPSGHDAFQDPFVFLLHANVDRLYAMWQCQPGQEWRLNAGLVYGTEASTTGLDGLKTNTLAPWDGTSGVHPFTPAGGLIQVKPYLDPSLVVPPCYDTLPITIKKVAPSGATPLRFLDVPTGSTTARALRLDVLGCASVHINGVLTGDPSFSLHQAVVQTPEPDGYVTTTVFMWVKYLAGVMGSTANGHIQATCPETGDTFGVDIVANAIAKPTVAASVVLDSSGSMSLPSGVPGLDRMAVLHQTAPTFVALLDDTDGVGVVRFDTDATSVSPIAVAGSIGAGGGRDNATAAVNAHATNLMGMTAIGDGIEAAHNQLIAGPPGFAQQAILVFTDGEETEPKYISDVASLINAHVYAVGLGTPNQLNPTGLSSITAGTGGYLQMTGSLGTDGVMRMAKYFSQMLAGVTNAQIVTDPPGFVQGTERVPFVLTDADQRCDVIVLTEAPFAIRLTLTAPDGTVVVPGPDAVALDAPAMTCLRVPLPLVSSPGAHGGPWMANLRADRRSLRRYLGMLEERGDSLAVERSQAHGIAYTLTVHAVSDLKMIVITTQNGHLPGSKLEIQATISDSGVPLERQAEVTVDMNMPDGTTHNVVLVEEEPGTFWGAVDLPQIGLYSLLVKANGQSLGGAPFTRQELRSAAVWIDPTGRSDDGTRGLRHWSDLLWCLLEDEQTRVALADRGVNIEAVRDCLARLRDRNG